MVVRMSGETRRATDYPMGVLSCKREKEEEGEKEEGEKKGGPLRLPWGDPYGYLGCCARRFCKIATNGQPEAVPGEKPNKQLGCWPLAHHDAVLLDLKSPRAHAHGPPHTHTHRATAPPREPDFAQDS